MITRVGTRYTPLQACRMVRRARRYAYAREHHEIDLFLIALRADLGPPPQPV